jgi:hypothetical protein
MSTPATTWQTHTYEPIESAFVRQSGLGDRGLKWYRAALRHRTRACWCTGDYLGATY